MTNKIANTSRIRSKHIVLVKKNGERKIVATVVKGRQFCDISTDKPNSVQVFVSK